MLDLQPFNQRKLFGLDKYLLDLIRLYENHNFPNKILLSGLKGSGKSTLAYHFINYALSNNESSKYKLDKFEIDIENSSFKTVLNKSNPNLILVDLNIDKKSIEINQIRDLIDKLNKSSFNSKPRFVLIDNIEFLNKNSINALLKILEEPNYNIHFILINNKKKILSTLLSRCVDYKISLSNKEVLNISNQLVEGKLNKMINSDLINYYQTPGSLLNLIKFGKINNIDLLNLNLKELLKILIKENHYKKDSIMKYMIFDLIEFYYRKINSSISTQIIEKYSHFLKKKSETKTYNLDEESLFMEFNEEILNG